MFTRLLFNAVDLLLIILISYILNLFFSTFLKKKNAFLPQISGYFIFTAWQVIICYFEPFSALVNIIVTVTITCISVALIFNDNLFTISGLSLIFNTLWMLIESISVYLLHIENSTYQSFAGTLFSNVCLFVVVLIIHNVFNDEKLQNIPINYNIPLLMIPLGSIFIMNKFVMISPISNTLSDNIQLIVIALILIGINLLVFNTYLKLTSYLHLKKQAALYEQQLAMNEKHLSEQELNIKSMRMLRHNIKNDLIALKYFAKEKKHDEIINYISEMQDKMTQSKKMSSHTGNLVIDSLIQYWLYVAEQENICIVHDICIPIDLNYNGADLCLILGNLLENAVEAVRSLTDNKYVRIQIKYDRCNLLISVSNSYTGVLRKDSQGNLMTTKDDSQNHGIGIMSVRHAAEKYHGIVYVDDSIENVFTVRVVLYETPELCPTYCNQL